MSYLGAVPPRERDEFDVAVSSAHVPDEVAKKRRRFEEISAGNEAVIQPRIEAQLTAYRAALDDVIRLHTMVANETDLDLVGASRQAAGWQVSGRVLSFLEAAMALVRAGFASEVAPMLRSIHEANQLLRALANHRDNSLLRLAGRATH